MSLRQSCPGFNGMCSISNKSCQVLFEQGIFPLIFINKSTNLLWSLISFTTSANARWMSNHSLWIPFEHSKFSFILQAHSSITLTSKICPLIMPLSGDFHCQDLHCYKQSRVFFDWQSPCTTQTLNHLGSLLTNMNFLHSQKAEKNYFHGPFRQAILLP